MEPTVSIIVPVYNAQKTLRRCVDSILDQEYEDYELLLIDDGSRDESGSICDAYAARDRRIRVFHKENGGVSAARNLALEQARGAYLQFLDSDDWITPDATKLLVRAAQANHCDLVVADFYRVVGERVSRKGDIDDDTVLSREEYAAHMMENPADFYYGVLWNKLYRRQIVVEHHLQMDPDISWCEDFLFNLEYIRHAETFCALQVPIYYYVKTKGSLANQGLGISKSIKMKWMLFDYYQQFFKSVLDEEEYERCRLKVYRFLIDAAQDGAVPPSLLPGSKRLGDERQQVCATLLEGEGVLYDAFRDRKLLEHYLEIAAMQNDMSLNEVWLLLALRQFDRVGTRRELADFAGMSRGVLSVTLQKLVGQGLVKVEEKRSEPAKQTRFRLTQAAQPVLEDLALAQSDYETARLAGLSQEELVQYANLSRKIKDNIQAIL